MLVILTRSRICWLMFYTLCFAHRFTLRRCLALEVVVSRLCGRQKANTTVSTSALQRPWVFVETAPMM